VEGVIGAIRPIYDLAHRSERTALALLFSLSAIKESVDTEIQITVIEGASVVLLLTSVVVIHLSTLASPELDYTLMSPKLQTCTSSSHRHHKHANSVEAKEISLALVTST
jgi:hypothetical protein